MTYDTVLNLFMIVAIPAVILVSYKLFSMSRKKTSLLQDGSPFIYELDPDSGEIVFADEKPHGEQASSVERVQLETGRDEQDISMVDVLAPEDEELARLSPRREQEKIVEELET